MQKVVMVKVLKFFSLPVPGIFSAFIYECVTQIMVLSSFLHIGLAVATSGVQTRVTPRLA